MLVNYPCHGFSTSLPQAGTTSLQCLPMLADTLRQARRKKGRGVLDLSKRSGVSRGIIQQVES